MRRMTGQTDLGGVPPNREPNRRLREPRRGARVEAGRRRRGDRGAHQLAEPVRPETARRLGEAHLILSRLAERQERQLSRLGGLGRVPVVRLPLAEREMVDIEGLAQLTDHFRGEIRAGGFG
jgi:hypothetical protein